MKENRVYLLGIDLSVLRKMEVSEGTGMMGMLG